MTSETAQPDEKTMPPPVGEPKIIKDGKNGNTIALSRTKFAILILAAFLAMFLVSLVCCPSNVPWQLAKLYLFILVH